MPRWFRRRTTVEADARWDHRRASVDDDGNHDFTVTVNLGGFGDVRMRWPGASREDVRDAFLEYLHNDAEFADGLRYPTHRSVHVRFNGRHMLLTFRTDWVAGFTVR